MGLRSGGGNNAYSVRSAVSSTWSFSQLNASSVSLRWCQHR
jgi:hypothetical protein